MLTLCSRRYYAVILLFFLLGGGTFLFYPFDPEIGLVRTRLNHIEIQTTPKPTLNLSFSFTVKVRNRDYFPLSYDSLNVSVSYRGRQIGSVSSVDGGRLRARGSLYVDVLLTVDGFEVIYDAFYLLQDIAKGVIPFDIDTIVEGNLGRFFFDFPLKATVSRQVDVNINSVMAMAIVGILICVVLSHWVKRWWIRALMLDGGSYYQSSSLVIRR